MRVARNILDMDLDKQENTFRLYVLRLKKQSWRGLFSYCCPFSGVVEFKLYIHPFSCACLVSQHESGKMSHSPCSDLHLQAFLSDDLVFTICLAWTFKIAGTKHVVTKSSDDFKKQRQQARSNRKCFLKCTLARMNLALMNP